MLLTSTCQNILALDTEPHTDPFPLAGLMEHEVYQGHSYICMNARIKQHSNQTSILLLHTHIAVDCEVKSIVYFFPSLFIVRGHREGFTEVGK